MSVQKLVEAELQEPQLQRVDFLVLDVLGIAQLLELVADTRRWPAAAALPPERGRLRSPRHPDREALR